MRIRVECQAGHGGEPEPVVFWLGQRRLAVLEVVDRWFAPTKRWFKVDVDDKSTYVVRHDEVSGEWDLVAYRRADAERLG